MMIIVAILFVLFFATQSNAGINEDSKQNSSTLMLEPTFEWDPNGYVFFCLCMGRFGNQVEHFLGGMAFAKALNRTLVVPPWITYKTVPFTEWFELKPLTEYHRVILAEDFMKKLAPGYWPAEKRKGYCWLPPTSKSKCVMKEGFPFKAFWDGVGVDFSGYATYHLSSDVTDDYVKNQWKEMFPPNKHPVLAFRGAPAAFPIRQQHLPLQKYLKWSKLIEDEAENYISKFLQPGKFVGIHLRNEESWISSCKYGEGLPVFMESSQCLGYSRYRRVTIELCNPSKQNILREVKKALVQTNAKYLFIATDNNPMIKDFEDSLHPFQVTVRHLNPERPQIDLAILGKADHFIGNCISSFTAFVKRERDIAGRSSSFWAFDKVDKGRV